MTAEVASESLRHSLRTATRFLDERDPDHSLYAHRNPRRAAEILSEADRPDLTIREANALIDECQAVADLRAR